MGVLSAVALGVCCDQGGISAGGKVALGSCVGQMRAGEVVDGGGARIGAWRLVGYEGWLKGRLLWKGRILGSS